MNVDYPYHFDGHGRTATTTHEEHVHDLIEQLLFTTPGERVMRPDFGSGLLQLVFAPVDDELASATQLLVHGALQQFLGNVIDVEAVRAEFADGVLTVAVQYVLKQTGERVVDSFMQEAP